MTLVDELIIGILRGPEGFKNSLKKILDEDLKMSVNDFCVRTGLSPSTIYKIMQEKREPNLRTVRSVLRSALRPVPAVGREGRTCRQQAGHREREGCNHVAGTASTWFA